jgi:acyl-[acyl carrier protein]--UDP-N-acetylglucosamine O-acyltransferase
MKISKSSIISEGAKIANNVSIGDFCHIGPNVTINENCKDNVSCAYFRKYNNWFR